MSNEKIISRRNFLKTAGGVAGATVFACSGITLAATRQPKVEMIETEFGKDSTMNKKILVAYGSRAGSTSEVAEEIGKRLSEAGASVDILNVKSVTDMNGYQAVVLGSAIRMGQWVPEMVAFIENNQAVLKSMPAAFFTMCLYNLDPSKVEEVKTYMDKPKALVAPKAEATFAGVMEYSKLKVIERILSKAMKSTEGDFRDWDAIRGWANDLPAKLGLAG